MGLDCAAVLRGVSGWVHISGLCSQSGRRAALDVPPRDPRRMQERLFLKLLCSVDPIGLQSTAVEVIQDCMHRLQRARIQINHVS